MSLTSKAIEKIKNKIEIENPNLQVIKVLDLPKRGTITVWLSDGELFINASMPFDGIEQFISVSLSSYKFNEKYNCIVVSSFRVLTDLPKKLIGRPMNANDKPGAPQFDFKEVEVKCEVVNTPEVKEKPKMPPAQFLKLVANMSGNNSNSNSNSNNSTNTDKTHVLKAPPNKPSGKTSTESKYVSISDLTPKNASGKFIKVKVINKTAIRSWKNAKSSGELASVDFEDEKGKKIRSTIFNPAFNPTFIMLTKDKVYSISNFGLKDANRKFSPIDNDYELSLYDGSNIDLLGDELESSVVERFNLCKIKNIPDCKENSVLDVAGIVLI